MQGKQTQDMQCYTEIPCGKNKTKNNLATGMLETRRAR